MQWQVSRLSMGERGRLGLLRTLSKQPKALLLDEPTANLDNNNRKKIEELIKSYQKKRLTPVLWISHHDEQQKRVSDRAYYLKEGLLHEDKKS